MNTTTSSTTYGQQMLEEAKSMFRISIQQAAEIEDLKRQIEDLKRELEVARKNNG